MLWVHLFPLAVPCVRLGDGAPSLPTDRGAHESLCCIRRRRRRAFVAIPNTEVKHMYADNTWRVTAREDR